MRDKDNKNRLKEMAQALGVSIEDLPKADFSKTEILSRRLQSNVKDIEVTIRPDGIQFNSACLKLFHDVEYVLVGIEKQNHWLVVNECERDDIDSKRWCNVKEDKRETRKITGRPQCDRIYKFMGWNKAYYYKVLGTLSLSEDEDDDEPYLVFTLDAYKAFLMSEKSRIAAGVSDEDVGADELEKIKKYYEEDARQAADAEARGEKPKRVVRCFYGGLAEDSFGVMRKDYKARLSLPRLDSVQSFSQLHIDDL